MRGLHRLLFLLQFLWISTASADEVGIPANTILLFSTPNLATSCESFVETPLGRALTGSEFAPLRDRLAAADVAAPLNPLPLFGVDWPTLAAMKCPCHVVLFTLPDDSTGAALVFAATEGAEALPTLQLASAYFAGRGYQPVERRNKEARLTVFTKPASDDPTRVIIHDPRFSAIVDSAIAADYLLAAPPDEAAARTARPAHEHNAAGVVFTFIRPWELARAARDRNAVIDVNDANEVARRVGWDKLQFLSGSLRFGSPAEAEIQATLDLQIPRPFEQAMRLLDFQPGPLDRQFSTLPHQAEASSLVAFRWDFNAAMEGFATLFDDANEPGPDGVGLFDDLLLGLLEDPEGPQVDLRRDVFAHLGPSVSQQSVHIAGDESSGTLYSIEVRDHAAIQDSLLRYYDGDDRVAHEIAGRFERWTVPPGNSLFVEGENDSLVTLCAMALTKERLFVSTHKELIDSLLATGEDDKPADAAWQAALQGQPISDAACLFGVWNTPLGLRHSYREAIAHREPARDLATKMLRMALVGSTEAAADSPLAAAPSFDSIQGALPAFGMELTVAETGFQATLRSLSDNRSPQPQ